MSIFENILQLIQENTAEAIRNNPDIPQEKKEPALHTIADTIQTSLQQQVQTAGLGMLTNIFSNSHSSPAALSGNSLLQQITDQVAADLFTKLGLEKSAAEKIAVTVIPLIINKIIHKTNDPKDHSFTFDSLIGNQTGGNGGGIADELSRLF